MSDKDINQSEFLRLSRELHETQDPVRVNRISFRLRELNLEYFEAPSEPLEVKVPAS